MTISLKVTNKLKEEVSEMEILFSILCAIFAILASVFGVRNRINGTRTGAGSGICNDRSRYNDLVSDHKQLERNKDRISELDKRDDENIERCKDIVSRIRKREQKADISE